MGTLSVYNPDTFNADMIQLSLANGAEKYSNYQDHQNGAHAFAQLTLIIAMREYLITETDTDPETLTSPNAINEAYISVHRYDASADDYMLRDLRQSAFRYTIGTKLREFAVRHHAAGLTTAEVINLVLDAPQGDGLTPLRDYVHYFPSMRQAIRDYLSTQLNYLKRGQSRFPQKYISLWETSRTEHLQEIQHIPLTHVTEQVAAMQQHYQKLLDAFNALPDDPEYTRDRQRLTDAMNKTMSGIYQMTRDPAFEKPQTLQPLQTQTPIEGATDAGETD
ncbi:hypothetical protein F4Z98_03365 [Candidatus Poribacteria bacterium]|nr:hypothetical protein [Candidatus Poribacteria bacterium]MYA99402.1 hypothetical protein [Candidatus Poribacteria bacterium]